MHMLQAPSLKMPLEYCKEEAGLYKLSWKRTGDSVPLFVHFTPVASNNITCCNSSNVTHCESGNAVFHSIIATP